MRFVGIGIVAMMLATPSLGQEPRSLPVPAGKGWQHAETGLVLTARIDGLDRTALVDGTTMERDVVASFDNADRTISASIYLFHPAIVSVPVWFDRMDAAIRARDLFGGVRPVTTAPLAFVPPTGGGTASGLRQVYATGKGPFRATGAGMMPLGEWLVAIRVSVRTLDPAALDAAMSRIIAGLRWPQGVAPASVAVPVIACTTPLPASRAKLVARNGANTLMDSLMGIVSARAASAPSPSTAPATWCRDDASVAEYGVYRVAGSAGYTIALGDAGRSVGVTPSIDTQIDRTGKPRTSVLLSDVDGTTATYDSFDRLPLPRQVVDLVGRGGAQSRISQAGDKVNISLPSR